MSSPGSHHPLDHVPHQGPISHPDSSSGPFSAEPTAGRPKRSMALTDLAEDQPSSKFDKALQFVPRVLSSKPHILWLMALGVYLILLPLLGIAVSAKSELIGGNYTNVTSDIGACIAAGGTLHLVNQSRKRQKADAERQQVDAEKLTLLKEVRALLRHLHPDAAAELDRTLGSPPDEI